MARKSMALLALALVGACNGKPAGPGNCISSAATAPAWHETAKYTTSGGFLLSRGWSRATDALSGVKPPDFEQYYSAHFEFRKTPDGKYKVQVFSIDEPFYSGLTRDFYAKVYWNGGYFDLPLRDPMGARRDAFRAEAGQVNPFIAGQMFDTQFDSFPASFFWTETGHGMPAQSQIGRELCSLDGLMTSSLRAAPNNHCLPFQYGNMREFEVVTPIPLGIAQRLEEMEAANKQKRTQGRLEVASRELMDAWVASFEERYRVGVEYNTALLAAMLHKCRDATVTLPALLPSVEDRWNDFCVDAEKSQQVLGRHFGPNGASLATITVEAYRQKEAQYEELLQRQLGLYERIMSLLQRDRSLLRLESNFHHPQVLGGVKPAFLSIPVQERLPVLDGFFFEIDGRIPWFSIDASKVPAAREHEFGGSLLAVEGNYPFLSFTSYEVKEETDGFANFVLPVSNNADDNRRAATVVARPNGANPASPGVVVGPASDPEAVDASAGQPRTVNCP